MRSLPVILFLLFTSCTSFHPLLIESDADVDISQFNTCRWRAGDLLLDDSLTEYFPRLDIRQLQANVNLEMTKKGYHLADSSSQLELHYHLIVKDTASSATPTYDYESLSLWECSFSDGAMYKRGTLILDLVDRSSGHLIWRSRYVGILNPAGYRKNTHELARAVPVMMKSLPQTMPQR